MKHKIDWKKFCNLETFYIHFNQVFEKYIDYKIQNLDSLNDFLYVFKDDILIRKNSKKSQLDLWVFETKNFWQKKLGNQIFNQQNIISQLKDLESWNWQTLFEIILEIFSTNLKVFLK